MGGGVKFRTFGDEPSGPPANETPDERLRRWATEQERVEWDIETLGLYRGTHDRGTGNYRSDVEGMAVGQAARSEADLLTAIRRRLRHAHPTLTIAQADTFITTAVNAYRKRFRVSGPDWAFVITAGLLQEHRTWQAERDTQQRAQRRQSIVGEIGSDKIRQANLAWQDKVNRLVVETGLDYNFVEDFLKAYHEASNPMRAAKIDPKLIPFIQVQAPLYGLASMIKMFLPGVGLYEAVTGKDMLSGKELATWERVLGGLLDVAPYLPSSVTRPIGRGGKAALAGGRAIIRAGRTAAVWAISAVRAGVKAEVMLRAIGRMARIPFEAARALLRRIQAARRARKQLVLTGDDHEFMRGFSDAFKEWNGPTTLAPVIKNPTMRRFIFGSLQQMHVLGRTLGRPLARTVRPAVRAGLQAADDVADGLLRRIRTHWDAALGKGGETADAASRRVFGELVRATPANPSEWVRPRLYDRWRQRALRRIYNDAGLRSDLAQEAGIIVAHNPSSDSFSIHLWAEGPSGRTKVPIDFDHANIGHSPAVRQALNRGDYRELMSTVDSANLQLMTGRENRNVIEELRKAAAAGF